MAKSEADYKRELVKSFRHAGAYARRVEDAFSVGFPDLVLASKTTGPIFAEAKIFEGRVFAPSPRQWIELDQQRCNGCTVCVMGFGVSGLIFIGDLPDNHALSVHISDCVVQQKDETYYDTVVRWYKERSNVKG